MAVGWKAAPEVEAKLQVAELEEEKPKVVQGQEETQ
jgi:hypothetical protein